MVTEGDRGPSEVAWAFRLVLQMRAALPSSEGVKSRCLTRLQGGQPCLVSAEIGPGLGLLPA